MPMREDDIGHAAYRIGSAASANQTLEERREEGAVLQVLGTARRLGWRTDQVVETLDVLGLLPAAERVRKQIKERKAAHVVRTS